MLQGHCNCGQVRVTVEGPIEGANACHCSACRRVSGHFEASVDVPRDRVHVTGAEHLTWYQSSAKVRRGFCSTCGSNMFWDPVFQDWTAVALGCLTLPSGLRLTRHIYVGDQGDYYDIGDGLPQDMAPPG